MKINKILLIFILIILASSVLLWNGIQSDWVGRKFSAFITKQISTSLSAQVKFKSLDIKLFPPGIELNDVSFKDIKENNLKIESKEVGVSFDLIKSMQKELTLNEIYLRDSKVSYSSDTKETSNSNDKTDISSFSIKSFLRKMKKKLPIKLNKLTLDNVDLNYNDESFGIRSLNLSPKTKEIELSADINFLNKEYYGLNLERLKLKSLISDKEIIISDFNLKSIKSNIEIKGIVKNFRVLKKLNLNLDYSIDGDLDYFNSYLKKITSKRISKGKLHLDGFIKGKLNKYNSSSNLELIDFSTPYVNGDKALAKIDLNEKELRVNRFLLTKDNQQLKLLNSFQFLDLKTRKFIEEPIIADLKKVRLTNGLKVLADKLSILDAQLSGQLKFVLNESNYNFSFDSQTLFENISLSPSGDKIIDIPILYSNKGFFEIYKDKFQMNLSLYKDKTKLSLDGLVNFNGPLKFSSKDAQIDLSDLGKIAGVSYEGVGLAQINVIKNKTKSNMYIDGEFEDFKLDKYKQDKVSAKIDLNFNNFNMYINNIKANSGRTKSTADLQLDLKTKKIQGEVKHIDVVYDEIVKSLSLPEQVHGLSVQGDWSSSYKLSGYLDPKKIIVKGKIKGLNNLFFDETFESMSAHFKYRDERLNIDNILLRRLNGIIEGSYQYSLKTKVSNFLINPKDLSLEEFTIISKFPLGINGRLSGQISGAYKNSLTSLLSELKVKGSSIPGKKIGDSYLRTKLNKNIFDIELKLLGNKILIDSKNYLNDQKPSKLNFETSIDDINEVIGTNRLVDLEDTDISGAIFSKGFLEYNIQNLKIINSSINLKKASFKKDAIDFNYENENEEEVLVKNGLIKAWDFYLRGKNFYFISNAKGAFDKTFKLDADFKIDASIFEVLNKIVSKASGAIYGKYSLSDLKDLPHQKIKVKANGLSLSTSGYPLRFEDINFLVNVDNNKIIVDNLSSKLGAGKFTTFGEIDFHHLVPKLNFDFKFTNAGITLFEKSNMTFSGQGHLKGNRFPYDFKSQFYVENLNLINEFTDLISKSGSYSDDIKYLPNSQAISNQNLLDLDIDVKTLNPISVKNSMADLSFLSRLKITGSELNPLAKGSAYLAPGVNKVFFKGNEYDILKSNILFYNNRAISNPELDIEASSKIESYRLNAKVTGGAKNFNLDLRSDPFLEKSDILSLIAFGYTENTSTSLSEEQKSLMTQAGIGSLLFERFKINETLKKELGIQLNLGTEISNVDDNYLSQRSATGANGQRVTSATKIEIKKEISSKVDLAVSSTVGSSVGQRQRMNLDYKVSDKLSLEGIYESRTDTQGITQGTDSSLGMDVRVKWTFK